MDGFHLADVELDRLGRRDRKGAPDTFDARVRRPAAAAARGPDDVCTRPASSGGSSSRSPAHPDAPAARLVVTEGNYLLLAATGTGPVAAGEVWYAELDEPERLRRLVARHAVRQGARGREPGRTGPTSATRLVAGTRDRADLIVPAALLRALGSPAETVGGRRQDGAAS